MTGADRLRFVLQRFGDGPLRITFSDGEVFVVRCVSELPDDEGEQGASGSWSGEVVATANLSPKRERLFVSQSGVDFKAADVLEVVDDRSSKVLYTRPA